MAFIYKAEEFLKEVAEMKETDMENPKCTNCNECCSIQTLITKKERMRIYRFLESNPEIKERVMARTEDRFASNINLKCPFSSDETKKCDIYNARPDICKEYHCTPKLKGPNVARMKKKNKLIIGDIFGLSEKELFDMMKKALTPHKK